MILKETEGLYKETATLYCEKPTDPCEKFAEKFGNFYRRAKREKADKMKIED